METFNFPVNIGPETEYIHNNLKTDFGESNHEHQETKGLNPISRRWSVTLTAQLTELKQVRDFIRRHKGFKTFLWMTPEGETVKVKANEIAISTHGGLRGKISMTFEEDFKP